MEMPWRGDMRKGIQTAFTIVIRKESCHTGPATFWNNRLMTAQDECSGTNVPAR